MRNLILILRHVSFRDNMRRCGRAAALMAIRCFPTARLTRPILFIGSIDVCTPKEPRPTNGRPEKEPNGVTCRFINQANINNRLIMQLNVNVHVKGQSDVAVPGQKLR